VFCRIQEKSVISIAHRNAIHRFLFLFFLLLPAPVSAEGWRFEVQFDSSVHDSPYTGRVYLFLTESDREPRQALSWFRPQPLLSMDVVGWKPGETLVISTGTHDHDASTPVPGHPPRPASRSADEKQSVSTTGPYLSPQDFHDRDLSGLRVQAVARFNPYERTVGNGPGNGYSDVVRLDASGKAALTIRHRVPEREFRETKWTQELRVRSELLSEFHDREIQVQGAVTLPAGYFDEPERRYPVIVEIPGFGGTHHMGIRDEPVAERNDRGVEFIRVMLDPSCPLGHHVFANSENNGPWGDALVREFLPELDRRYRTDARPEARFLTGHSSGGWSSLWLQVTYPDRFGGTWSTAPDPVDFRSFQYIDLYRPGENMYVTPKGERRPLARRGDEVLLWYDDFARMEDVLGYGGQLHSFEAVFSPRGEDGSPELLWDRKTGEIDPDVARTWKRYDIRDILETEWDRLGPQLAGKLHVYMGTLDTFYLEGATELLKETLERLESDAVVEMIPGRDHSNLFEGGLKTRIEQLMAEKYLEAGTD
jgi:S-formylglutathione hydrolase FrmB